MAVDDSARIMPMATADFHGSPKDRVMSAITTVVMPTCTSGASGQASTQHRRSSCTAT